MTPAACLYVKEYVREHVILTLRRWFKRPAGPTPVPKAWYKDLVWDVAADTGEFTSIIKDGAHVTLAISRAKEPE